jgi:uncharacterized protein YodC (DUF2158 family)
MSDTNSLSDFRVGDLVELRSGGSTLTVESISAQQGVGCVWFPAFPHTLTDSGAWMAFGEPTRASFPAAALTKKGA